MRNILFVIPSLEYGGAARQLTLIAANLPRDRFGVRVCVLGFDSPWAELLRKTGVEVSLLGWKRPLDLKPFLALRALVRALRPEVVHVWGPAALRAVALAGHGPGRLVVSAALPPGGPPGRLDRWLLRRAGRVVAFGGAEAERYREAGVGADRVCGVAPAVGPGAGRGAATWEGVPAAGRVLLGIGPIEPHKGFRDAVWALDILNYLYDDLHLVLAGAGSDRARVAAFAQAVGARPRVHFAGPCDDLGPLLRRAEVVWVPSRTGGGACAALEAMAAGRPVVAARLPALAEVVIDDVTGYLVRPGDKAELARQTRVLLDDAALRRRLGAAGRRRAADHFAAADLVERLASLYNARAS